MKKIAIVTPGGDAPGMNACIRAVVRDAISMNFQVIGVLNGYQGLIDDTITEMNLRSVSGIIHHGGTILKSSRCLQIKSSDGIKKAASNLKRHKINYLVVIGGDGSINAGLKISKYGIHTIGIPASIDNDICGTDETIGFDTAIDTAVEAIDKIRDTAASFDRIFVIEVMGREHGFLALEIGLASGAEFVLIPEIRYNIDKIAKEIKKKQENKKSSCIIIFAEGCGNSKEFASQLSKKTSLEVRVSNLGYIQRGGNPSARSRNLAARFGAYAVSLIKKDAKNRIVVIKNNKISSIPIITAVSGKKFIDSGILRLINKLAV